MFSNSDLLRRLGGLSMQNGKTRQSVLIVEDQAYMREIVAEDFSISGWETVQAEHGEEALAKLQGSEFDLIVSDIRMPVMDGAKFLDELRKTHRHHPPLIFMTGYTDLKIYDLLDRGAHAVLAKPLELANLLSSVKDFTTLKDQRWTQIHTGPINDHIVVTSSVENSSQLDFGQEGFFVANELLNPSKNFEPNQFVSFEIPCPHTATAKLSGIGKIVWSRQNDFAKMIPGYGIQYIYLDEPGRSDLINSMASFDRPATIPIGSKKA